MQLFGFIPPRRMVCSFIFRLQLFFSFSPLAVGALLLSRATKVSKSALSPKRAESATNYRQTSRYLLFITISAHLYHSLKGLCLSIICCVSALILREGVLPYFSFKTDFMQRYRYFVLFIRVCFLHFLLLQLTLYSLPESLSDAFFGWFGVSLMGMFRVSFCWRYKKLTFFCKNYCIFIQGVL